MQKLVNLTFYIIKISSWNVVWPAFVDVHTTERIFFFIFLSQR